MLSFARDVTALAEVIAAAPKSNAASLAVMERLGFMRESQSIFRPARIARTARTWLKVD